MNATSLMQLLALAAIWGGSFLLMRIAAPVLGAVQLVGWRLLLAALFLLAVACVWRKALPVRRHWRHFLLIGFFGSALPFLLYGYAAHTLGASILAILNATAPIWGAVIAAIWTGAPLSRKTIAGLVLGMSGVALIVGLDPAVLRPGTGLAVLAGVTAPISYGIVTVYTKIADTVDPFANAHGGMWGASVFVLPAMFVFPAPHAPTSGVLLAVLALGIVCSGIAYLFYFRLVAEVGAASAMTVAFLIPVFGIAWGHVFLDEPIGWQMIAGSVIVLVGTVLVTGFSFRSLLPRGRIAS